MSSIQISAPPSLDRDSGKPLWESVLRQPISKGDRVALDLGATTQMSSESRAATASSKARPRASMPSSLVSRMRMGAAMGENGRTRQSRPPSLRQFGNNPH